MPVIQQDVQHILPFLPTGSFDHCHRALKFHFHYLLSQEVEHPNHSIVDEIAEEEPVANSRYGKHQESSFLHLADLGSPDFGVFESTVKIHLAQAVVEYVPEQGQFRIQVFVFLFLGGGSLPFDECYFLPDTTISAALNVEAFVVGLAGGCPVEQYSLAGDVFRPERR